MSKITVVRDPNITLPPIYDVLLEPAADEGAGNVSENPQTHVNGILAPLIRFGNLTVRAEDVVFFHLESTGFIPECVFKFNDSFGYIKSFDKFDKNTDVQIQLVPAADNMARKINIVFIMDSVDITGNYVTCHCVYKCKGLYDTRLESYGQITTYELFDKVSNQLQLGFASNVKGTNDKRWIYASSMSLVDLLQQVTKEGGEATIIPDAWIDFRNNLIFEDLYSRYNDFDKGLKIKALPSALQDTRAKQEPFELPGLTNSTLYHNCSLYVKNMRIVGEGGDIVLIGDNRLLDTYNYINRKIDQLQLADSDYDETMMYRYEYCGEQFEDFNRYAQAHCNATFRKKITTNMIEVELSQPVLDLERGDRVNFVWYDYNAVLHSVQEQNGETETNSANEPVLNKQVSGQYLILGTIIDFENFNNSFKWSYKLRLTKNDKVTEE